MLTYLGGPADNKQQGTVGVLLVNLGTPDSPQPAAIRRYLAEFLSDPRVIEYPRWLWKIILHGIILRVRPAKVAHAYQSIWTDNGSPLYYFTQQQSLKISEQLKTKTNTPLEIAFAMRYGKPSIPDTLRELQQKNIQSLVVVPLYPQYSATTTGSSFDAVVNELVNWRRIPDFRFIMQYYKQPGYISSLVNSIQQFRNTHGSSDILLFSFHGLPERYVKAGDPYFDQCRETVQLVTDSLGLTATQWQLSFQSRVGREEWLKPYTDEVLIDLARKNKSVQVICPGFASDCLETLEEINMQNRELFINNGGSQYHYIPALNDQSEHIDFLSHLVLNEIQRWEHSAKDNQ